MTIPAHAPPPDRCESCTGSLDREPSDPSPAHTRCRACVEADRSRAMVGRGPTVGPSAALSPPRVTVGRTLPALFRGPTEGAAAPPATPPVTEPRTRVLPPLAPLSGGMAVVWMALWVTNLAGVFATGCNPIRNAAMTTVAGPPDGCAPRAYRCHAGAPEVCSASRRWWPTLPRDPTGVPRVCTGSCRIDPRDSVAFCSPLPPDADPSEDAPVSLPPPSPPPAQHGAHGAM